MNSLFSYLLRRIPEPATLWLPGVLLVGLLAYARRKRRPSPGNRINRLLGGLILGIMLSAVLAGAASAANLRVILIGTGEGDVEGEDISCEPLCEYTYDEGTAIQLKAYPEEDSTFEGWMVNGKPHEGVITMAQEDILLAARFERKVPPDDQRVMWYNGNDKEYATMALDEIAIFLEEKPERWYDFEGEFKITMDEITRLFHPHAEIFEYGPLAIVLKCPEPFSREQLPDMIARLKTHTAVRQAGPVLYQTPGDRNSQVIPVDEIIVEFPESYTEATIHAIEQEYDLKMKVDNTYSLTWYLVENPLISIDIANRLYESGLVGFSGPEILIKFKLDNQLLEEDSSADRWHFREAEQHGASVFDAWELHDADEIPIRISGVAIAVVDDGIEMTLPALGNGGGKL